MTEDKRKFLRFGAFLEGVFSAENGLDGLIMLTNFSKEGVKASLNRKLSPGTIIKLEIQFPGSIVPLFAKGKIIWIKKGNLDWTYGYDVGLKWQEIVPEDRRRILDFAYEYWFKAKGKT